jgi:tetratricopeptide (TPR) repeat protein
MSQLQDRIAQFRKMAHDDPENELGHFRLGQLLMDAGQMEEAAESFQRALQLNPQFSKVYQLLGNCLSKLNRREEAIETLRQGYQTATERGDNIPREEIGKLLVQLGEAVPDSRPSASRASAAVGTGFRCQRPGCLAGSSARQMPAPPMKDDLGRQVHEKVCADCWNDWLRNYSIKVINEMRLDLSTERDQEKYDEIMKDYLGVG